MHAAQTIGAIGALEHLFPGVSGKLVQEAGGRAATPAGQAVSGFIEKIFHAKWNIIESQWLSPGERRDGINFLFPARAEQDRRPGVVQFGYVIAGDRRWVQDVMTVDARRVSVGDGNLVELAHVFVQLHPQPGIVRLTVHGLAFF